MSFWKPRPVRHRPNCVLTVMPWWHYARQKETRCHSREVFQVWNRWRPRMSCTCRHIKKNLQKTAVLNLGMRTYPHCSHFYIQNLSLNFTSKKHWFHVDISLALSGLAADWQEPTKRKWRMWGVAASGGGGPSDQSPLPPLGFPATAPASSLLSQWPSSLIRCSGCQVERWK